MIFSGPAYESARAPRSLHRAAVAGSGRKLREVAGSCGKDVGVPTVSIVCAGASAGLVGGWAVRRRVARNRRDVHDVPQQTRRSTS